MEKELHETEGCECGCGEGWETNYKTHCAVIKVSTNREKLEKIKLDAERHNQEVSEYNQKMSEEYLELVRAENSRVNALYQEQLVRYCELFIEYKKTVNKGLTEIGKELYPDNKKEVEDWFKEKYCNAAYYTVYYKHQVKIILEEFFKRYPDLKLNDKDLRILSERDLKGYQNFQGLDAKPCRSTSVGDIIFDGEKYWKVKGIGFEEVDNPFLMNEI